MATMKEVSSEIISDLTKLEKLTGAVALDIFGETRDRIFPSSGGSIGSNGQNLGTYSKTTISLKKENNHFSTNQVNLQDTETLLRSYTFSHKQGGEVVFGFASASRKAGETNLKIMKKLEKQYGEIFGFTKKELVLIDDLIEDFTEKLFN
jgi:hypothetical protein